ncbi:hypothetical protein D3C75_1218480 [compost metagenome]
MFWAFFRQIENREVLSNDLLFGITLDPFCACVPTGDVARSIESENPVVLYAVNDQTQPFFILTQCSFTLCQ